MRRLAMTIPLESLPLAQQADFVRELADLGYSDLWSSEAQDVDGFTPLALASQWAPGLRLGCACFPVQTRGPAVFAMSAAALAEAAPGNFVLGIGSSSPWIVQMQNARAFEKPYAQTRDMLRFLKRSLGGQASDGEYDTFAVRGFALRRKLAQPPPVLVAALRPQMLALAGREGDGAILNFVTPEEAARCAPLVREHGAHKEIAARIFVCPTTDAEAVRRIARFSLAVYLAAPAYRAQQEWLGNAHLLKESWDRLAAGDFRGARAALRDEVVDRYYIHGPAEYCRERIAAYHEAGVDTPIIGLIEPPMDPREAARLLAPR
ncbi:MAG TPA: LLM class F420-dependent oxidoreductase [Myxococcota bacterium]|nr:LLM class F420-dependent oxidoreductase [Myxococcota bacterium]